MSGLNLCGSGKRGAKIVLMLVLVLWILGRFCAAPASAQEPKKINIPAGKSVLHYSSEQVKRVSIGDPAVADFVIISPYEIYLTGRTAGSTNMILWQERGRSEIYEIDVSYDVARLKRQLNEVLPEEKELRVNAAQDSITLSGRVSNPVALSRVLSLAKAYAPESKIQNLLEVGGVQQVMLEVRVAEMQRSLVRRMGINFNYLTQSGKFGVTTLGGLTQLVKPTDANIASPAYTQYVPKLVGTDIINAPELIAPFSTLISPAVNALLKFSIGNTAWTGFIDALKSDGLVKVLAEPTLIALSGQKASFHAGGEFPVPVPQGLGTVAIEYKKFGVTLNFTPVVLADNKINITVAPEVSELDFAAAVQLSGFIIPGLSRRAADTVVELADGQSFAIAGLLKDSVRDTMDKFPLLGDLPILGALFRSKSFQKNETELIIIATPHLVKPLDMARQPLPTDFYVEPNDAEFYLLGIMEGQGAPKKNAMRGQLDGQFGHATPKR